MWEDFIFGDATYQLKKSKNVKSRKPSELPVEEDVIAFCNFVITKMADIAKDSYHCTVGQILDLWWTKLF